MSLLLLLFMMQSTTETTACSENNTLILPTAYRRDVRCHLGQFVRGMPGKPSYIYSDILRHWSHRQRI